jgi:hypothetical protein
VGRVYIGARNDFVAQAYTPIIFITVVCDGHPPIHRINNFNDGSRRASPSIMELKKPLWTVLCVWLNFIPPTHPDEGLERCRASARFDGEGKRVLS